MTPDNPAVASMLTILKSITPDLIEFRADCKGSTAAFERNISSLGADIEQVALGWKDEETAFLLQDVLDDTTVMGRLWSDAMAAAQHCHALSTRIFDVLGMSSDD